MTGLGSWSVRWWLAMLAAVTALPLLFVLGWIFVSQVRAERADAQLTALRAARITAGRLGEMHRDSRELLARLAARPAIHDFDAKGGDCDSLFASTDFFPQYVNLFLVDRSGAVVCSCDPAPRDAAISGAAQAWIAGDLRNGKFRPSTMALHQIGSSLVTYVSTPVPSGFLILVEQPDVSADQALPGGSVVAVLDAAGTILARSRGAEKWVGRSARGLSVTEVVLRRKEGTAEAIGVDGIARQYGFTYLPELRWHIYVGIPTSTVMQPVRANAMRAIDGSAVMVLLVILAALRLSRGIEQPIGRLAHAADVIATRGYVESIPSGGPREIVSLAESLQRMVDARRETEEQVRENESKLKSLSERLLTVQEEERTRIAREIHDDLGQSLTALKMDILGLLRTVPEGTGGAMPERIVRTIDSTVTAVQRIASELRPSLLDDLGFAAAVEAEARRFEERTGIECDLSMASDDAEIGGAMATAIYRIIQEALTNAGRHSDASRVEIRLRRRGGDLLLDIRDDGRGITPEQLSHRTSFGMIGISERAALLGGSMHAEGFPGRGTIISVRIPVERVS